MEDEPSVKLSKAEKHRILTQYQQAWRSFSPETARVQDIPLLDGPLWELSGGVLAQSVGRKILQFKQLPGIVRGVKPRDWTLEIDFTVDDFTFDPSQNLLLAIEGAHSKYVTAVPIAESFIKFMSSRSCYVRPLNLSTGERHSLAKEERLECPTPALTFHDRVYIIRACGDLFGLIVREPHVVGEQSDDRLVVRNWKTGDLLLVSPRLLPVVPRELKAPAPYFRAWLVGIAYLYPSWMKPMSCYPDRYSNQFQVSQTGPSKYSTSATVTH